MSAMVAVLVVCTGSLFLIQAVSGGPPHDDGTRADALWDCLEDLLTDGRDPAESSLSSVLEGFLAREEVNAASVEIRPTLPFGERTALTVGTPEGLRSGSVKTFSFLDDRGERLPYIVTLAVWVDV